MNPPAHYDDLDAGLAHAWAMLARGVADRRSAFRTPTLGTIGVVGSPQVRTVVLRGCDVGRRTLRFHTDLRSGKVAELQLRPLAALHFYDAGQKLQLRIAGTTQLHHDDDVARAAWAASQAMSRACYTQDVAPGRPIERASAIPQAAGVPDGATTGFDNFVAVVVAVHSIEWLYLGSQGHRRARFTWDGDQVQATWLAP